MIFFHTFAGTHDVQNISFTVESSGSFNITGNYVYGSQVRGLFAVIYSADSYALTTHYSILVRQDYQLRFECEIENEFDDDDNSYRLSAFLIDEEGIPFPRAAFTPKDIHFHNSSFVDSKTENKGRYNNY